MTAFIFLFFILVTCGGAVYTGVSYAAQPREQKLATLRVLSLAGILSSVSCTFAGFVSITTRVGNMPEGTSLEAMASYLLGGLSEMAVGGLVGFSLLAVAWLAAAVGIRRQP